MEGKQIQLIQKVFAYLKVISQAHGKEPKFTVSYILVSMF